MWWNFAADAVVVIHLLWIAFIIVGAAVGRRIVWVKWLHLGALLFSVLLQIFHWICPLTFLEVWLRRRADTTAGYPVDFIAHYAERLVYLPAPPEAIFALTIVIVGFSARMYWPQRGTRVSLNGSR